MSKLEKILLLVGIVTMGLDIFTEFGNKFAWGALKPIGIVALMMFYISYLMSGESAKFEAENPGGHHGGSKHSHH